jgi:hypothetical protein
MAMELSIGLIFLQKLIGTDQLPFWPFILILFLSGVVLYVRAINTESWTLLFRSTYSSRAVSHLTREKNAMENSFFGLLVFIFFLSFALLIYNIQLYAEISPFFSNPALFYPLILLVLFGIYIAKISLLFLLQFIFQEKEIFDEYIIVFMNINIVLGISLIPLHLLYSYGLIISKPITLGLAGLFLLISLILRYFRVFEIGLRNKVKWYNLILYICTLEFMPIILIFVLIKNIGIDLNFG